MTLSAQDIQRMSLLAMNAEMEPGHRFVNDLGDALQDALDEIERLRVLLNEALSHLEYHRQEFGQLRYDEPGLLLRVRSALGVLAEGQPK